VYYQNETLFAVAMVHGIYFEWKRWPLRYRVVQKTSTPRHVMAQDSSKIFRCRHVLWIWQGTAFIHRSMKINHYSGINIKLSRGMSQPTSKLGGDFFGPPCRIQIHIAKIWTLFPKVGLSLAPWWHYRSQHFHSNNANECWFLATPTSGDLNEGFSSTFVFHHRQTEGFSHEKSIFALRVNKKINECDPMTRIRHPLPSLHTHN
jgi:hypothetical protein